MSYLFLSNRSIGAAFAGCIGFGLTAGVNGATGDLGLLHDARVSGKFDQRLGEQLRGTRAEGSREGLEITLLAAMAYDDNIFRSATDAEEDLVTTITPRVSYTLGQPNGRAWVETSYEASGVVYWDNDEESRVDHRVNLKASMRRKMLKVAYAGSWAQLGNPDPDVGGSPDRMEWNNRVALGWEPRGETSGEIFADWFVSDQDSPFLNDVQESSVGLQIKHRYSPKSSFGLGYQIGETDVDGAAIQEFQRFTGQIEWQPRRKISVLLEGGAEYREFGSGGSNWEPVFSGRVAWTPRHGTELYVTGYRRVEASAFFDDQNFTVTGLAAGWSQRIRGAWSGRLEAGWEESDYSSTVGAAASRNDSAVFIRPSVGYLTDSGHSLQIFYQWSDSDSSDPGFGYSNQEIGASLDCQF